MTAIDIVDVETDDFTSTTVEDKYVKIDGTIASDTNLDYIKIPVVCGDKFRITSECVYNVALYGFIWLKGTTEKVQSVFPTTAQGSTNVPYDVTITIPTGVSYLVVSDGSRWRLPAPIIKKIKSGGTVDPVFTIRADKISLNNGLGEFQYIFPLYGKKINVIGDSMVKGHTLNDADVWTALLASRNNCTVRNYGVNGSYLSNHIPSGLTPERLPVIQRYTSMDNDADYVVVFAGTNDANNNISTGTDDSTDTETVKGALNVLCDGLITKYPASKICFITPYMRAFNDSYRNTIDAIKTICAKYSIPVFDNALYGGVYRFNDAQATALMLDNTHLNANGMKYVVSKYESFLKTL